jgi:hypothetical protein
MVSEKIHTPNNTFQESKPGFSGKNTDSLQCKNLILSEKTANSIKHHPAEGPGDDKPVSDKLWFAVTSFLYPGKV